MKYSTTITTTCYASLTRPAQASPKHASPSHAGPEDASPTYASPAHAGPGHASPTYASHDIAGQTRNKQHVVIQLSSRSKTKFKIEAINRSFNASRYYTL